MSKQIVAPDGKIIGELKESEPVADNEEYLRKKDFEHMMELEKASALAERYKAELERMVSGHPEPVETIKHWRECPNCKPKLDAFLQPLTDEAYLEGKADGKKNLTPDDLNINLVGDYLRKLQAIGIGKAKGDTEYRVIKGIKIGVK